MTCAGDGTPGLDGLRLCVVDGAGVIGRFDRVVLLALPMTASEFEFVDDLLRVSEMAAAQPESPGRMLARRVAGLLGLADPENAPAFCVLAECDTGTAVLLHGSLEVEVTGPRHLQRLSGRGVLTWIDNVITGSYDRLSVLPAECPDATADHWTDLRRGVVRGSGVVLTLSAVDSSADAAAPSVADLGSPTVATAGPYSSDPPTLTYPTRPQPDWVSGGSASAPAGRGVRTVRTDAGASYELDATYVIGRQPQLHPAVREGSAKPLTLDDTDELVSRVHARVLVTADGVQVVDEGSGNGTYVASPDSDGWRPLAVGVPMQVSVGMRLLVGDRELTFD